MPNTFAEKATIDPQAEPEVQVSTAQKQEPSSDPNVALIVGERAFATMEDVKTKITNQDQHITDIEGENATLRAQLEEANKLSDVSKSLEDVLNKDKDKDDGLTLDQIRTLVSDEVSTGKKQDLAEANSALCQKQAQTAYGDDFIVKMQEIATEVGLSMEEVDKLAEGNPRLFARTFLPSTQAKEAPAPSHTSTIRTSSFQDIPKGNEMKPVLSLNSKERTAQYVALLEALPK